MRTYHGGCPFCLTDEYIKEILHEEVVQAHNKKELEDIMARQYPDYLYFTSTSRGKNKYATMKFYILLK